MEEAIDGLRPKGVDGTRLAEPGRELLEACRRGERAALARLCEQTRAFVYGVALHASGDAVVAADATQEVYLKVMTHLHRFDGRSSFRTWLFRVTVNAVRDQQRRQRRYVATALPGDDADPTIPSAEEELLAGEQQVRVRRALAHLPPRLRLPLVLRYVGDLSYEEIGNVLSLRSGTVASRLSRGLARLGEILRGPVLEED